MALSDAEVEKQVSGRVDGATSQLALMKVHKYFLPCTDKPHEEVY